MSDNPSNRTWMQSYYAAVDAKRLDEAMSYFAPDAVMRFGSQDIVGYAAIEAVSRDMLDTWDLRHVLTNVWEPEDGTVVFEAEITYNSPQQTNAVTVQGAAVCRVADERWLEQRIYVDLAPVHEAMTITNEKVGHGV